MKTKALILSFFRHINALFTGRGGDSVVYFDRAKPVYLENGMSVLPSVQASREVTTSNGCKVLLEFHSQPNPQVRRDVAEMLLAAFRKRRSVEHETSNVPVQSVHQESGGQ